MKTLNIFVIAKTITQALSNSVCLVKPLIEAGRLFTQHVDATVLIKAKSTKAVLPTLIRKHAIILIA